MKEKLTFDEVWNKINDITSSAAVDESWKVAALESENGKIGVILLMYKKDDFSSERLITCMDYAEDIFEWECRNKNNYLSGESC